MQYDWNLFKDTAVLKAESETLAIVNSSFDNDLGHFKYSYGLNSYWASRDE